MNLHTKKIFADKLGSLIYEHRVGKLSQLELAMQVGVSESTIRNYEKGRTLPNIYELYKIATALDISLSDLLQNI